MAITPAPSTGFVDYSQLFSALTGRQIGSADPSQQGQAQPLQSSLQGALGTPTRTPLMPPGPSPTGGGQMGPGISRELGYTGQIFNALRGLDKAFGAPVDQLLSGGVRGALGTGTQAPTGAAGAAEGASGSVPGGALGTGASLLGLLTAAYNLSRGGEFRPGTAVGLGQGAAGLTGNVGSLLGSGSGLGSTLGALGSGAGTITSIASLPLAFGNVYNAFDADDPRAQAGGYGTLAGAGIGAGLGALIGGPLWPVTMLAGAGMGAGAGGTLGNIIGSNLPKPHSMAIRHHAAEVATDTVNNYGYGIQQAGQNGDLVGVQQALGRQFDNNTGVRLNLPRSVATALGVNPQAGFHDLTPQQFLGVLKAFQEHEGVNKNWFTGTSEIPYLKHDDQGGKIVKAMTNTAHSAMSELARVYAPMLEQMGPVAPLQWQNVGGGYRMAPQLDYGILANEAGPFQPLTFEQAQGYLGNPALQAGGVQYSQNMPVSLRGGSSEEMALRQLGAEAPTGGNYMMPSQVFASDWAGTQGQYQQMLDNLSYQAQQRVADLYQQQIRDTQGAF